MRDFVNAQIAEMDAAEAEEGYYDEE